MLTYTQQQAKLQIKRDKLAKRGMVQGCKGQHGDCGQQYCIVDLKVAKIVHCKSYHKKKRTVAEVMILIKVILVKLLQYIHHIKSLCCTP